MSAGSEARAKMAEDTRKLRQEVAQARDAAAATDASVTALRHFAEAYDPRITALEGEQHETADRVQKQHGRIVEVEAQVCAVCSKLPFCQSCLVRQTRLALPQLTPRVGEGGGVRVAWGHFLSISPRNTLLEPKQKSWVTPEVVSSNQGRIRLEMSRDATTRLRGR